MSAQPYCHHDSREAAGGRPRLDVAPALKPAAWAPTPPSRQPRVKTSGLARAARSVTAPLAVLVTSMAALGCTLGAATASAATTSAAPAVAATGVTWHKLALSNGWQSSQARYNTGDPAWAVRSGIVYLSGSMHQAAGSNPTFAVLPKAARPARALYITVYTFDGTTGHLYITPDGQMFVYSTPAGNARDYTSLAAVSFPAAGTAGHKLSLINGWKSSQSAWDTGDPAYSVRGGVVYLSGAMHQAAGTNKKVGSLPKAARPASVEYLTVYTDAGTTGQLLVYPKGPIYAVGAATRSFTSLAGISFPAAAAARHPMTLVNGWHSAQVGWSAGDPAYSVSGGVVYLSGSLAETGTSSEIAAVLPKAARPSHYLYIKTTTVYGTVGTIEITPGGQLWAYSQPPIEARVLTSLAAISYPLTS
ncbi:MAG TPA: hypothetical protein VN840_08415 [Streptosporangiaceae bacterium]|nr:hypothetical protein [Streptosporangiaceae bacterium]